MRPTLLLLLSLALVALSPQAHAQDNSNCILYGQLSSSDCPYYQECVTCYEGYQWGMDSCPAWAFYCFWSVWTDFNWCLQYYACTEPGFAMFRLPRKGRERRDIDRRRYDARLDIRGAILLT